MPCHHKPWCSGPCAGNERLPAQLLQAPGPGPKALQQPACRGQRRRETPRPSVDVSCSAVVSSVEAWREIERLPGREAPRPAQGEGRGGHQISCKALDATLARRIYAGRAPSPWTVFPVLQARISSPAADPESLWSRPLESIMKTLSVFAAALLTAVSEAAVNVRCVPPTALTSCQLP